MFLGLCSPFALLVYEAVAVLPASGSSDSVESAGFSHCRPGMPSPPSLHALRPVPFLCSQPAPMPPPHTDTSPRTRPSHPFVLRPQNSGLVPLPTETDPCGVVLEDRLRWFFVLFCFVSFFGSSPDNRSDETERRSLDRRRGKDEEGEAGKQNSHSVLTPRADPTYRKRPVKKKPQLDVNVGIKRRGQLELILKWKTRQHQ